jgi:hypothetical protein
MRGWTPNVASPKWWPRGLATVGVVALTWVWTIALSALADLPSGYGGAQSKDGPWLKARAGRWSEFLQGTTRDLARYVPGYLLFGVLLIGSVVFARRAGTSGISSRRDRVPALVASSALVIGVAADVVETLLFRHSLTRLIDSSGTADVSTSTSVTLVMTIVKWAALGASLLALVGLIWREPVRTATQPTD